MDNEEKNIMDEFKEAVKDELNSTEETQNEYTILDSKQETNNEELDTNVDEVINNAFNKEKNNTEDVVTSNIEDNERFKNNNHLIIIILLLLLIVIGLGIYFIYDKFLKDDNNDNTNNNTTTTKVIEPTTTTKVQEINANKGIKTLYIYKNKKIIYDMPQENDNELIFKYNCENKDCSGEYYSVGLVDYPSAIVITDGTQLSIYNYEKFQLTTKLELNENEKFRSVAYDNQNIVGLVVEKITNSVDEYEYEYELAYFDIIQNKYITDFEYMSFVVSNDKLIGCKGLGTYSEKMSGSYPTRTPCHNIDVIDTNSGKTVKTFTSSEDDIVLSPVTNNSYVYYLYHKYIDSWNWYNWDNINYEFEILNSNFEHIAYSKSQWYSVKVLDNGNIMMLSKNRFTILDMSGNIIYNSKGYEQLRTIDYKDYIAVVDNNILKIIDLEENVIAEFDNWNSNLELYIPASYFTSSDERYCGITDIKDGIYIMATEKNLNENNYAYYYNVDTKEKDLIITSGSCLQL